MQQQAEAAQIDNSKKSFKERCVSAIFNPRKNPKSYGALLKTELFNKAATITTIALVTGMIHQFDETIDLNKNTTYQDYVSTDLDHFGQNAPKVLDNIARAVIDFAASRNNDLPLDIDQLYDIMVMKALQESRFGKYPQPLSGTKDRNGAPTISGLYHHSTMQWAVRLHEFGLPYIQDDILRDLLDAAVDTNYDANTGRWTANIEGADVRLTVLELRNDPYLSTLVELAYLTDDLLPRLQSITPDENITLADIYMEHVVGLGAYQKIKTGNGTPEDLNNTAAGNPGLFFHPGYERQKNGTVNGERFSFAEIEQAFDRRVDELFYDFQQDAMHDEYGNGLWGTGAAYLAKHDISL